MSLFRSFRGEKPYAVQLLEEQNALLRELVQAVTGRAALTARRAMTPEKTTAPRTDKDVSVVTRGTVRQQEQEARQRREAPWRTPVNGQASDPRPSSPGEGPEPPLPGVPVVL